MLRLEDIAFQLVDLPPISPGHLEPWMAGLLQMTDAIWLVVDLADPACTEHVPAICWELAQRKISLTHRWPGLDGGHVAETSPHSQPNGRRRPEDSPGPLAVQLPTLLVANKCDLDPDPDEVKVLQDLAGVRFPAIAVSAKSGHGLARLAPFMFSGLRIVRVYTKPPGHLPDRTRPFIVRQGNTVSDVARLVHHDVARSLKFARLWGSGAFDGQPVGPDHTVADGDIVELHAK
jgi:ribosome-interacting GTPase 1